ncbi:hypothetical protein [Rugamonas aquatica]|nr:hypothetical protein [Rugamonas aquatica]
MNAQTVQQLLTVGVLGACVWGVLNPSIRTRTIGTLALSLIGILAFVSLI